MRLAIFATVAALTLHCTGAKAYDPPPASKPFLSEIDFTKATPLVPAYALAFNRCDGEVAGGEGKNTFDGVVLKPPYLCADRIIDEKKQFGDPTRLSALLRLQDGAIFWQSKMALDVDGAWAAWNGLPGATDLKCTTMSWTTPNTCDDSSTDPAVRANQIDPDKFPFVVMPTNGLKSAFGGNAVARGQRFAKTTGLKMGDMGVAIYGKRWTPVFIADGGPFMRLGEGSSRVFEELGQSRCKKWNADHTICIGPGNSPENNCSAKPSKSEYPYCNFGISRDVIFILYPNSRDAELSAQNARKKLCDFAQSKLKLTGSSYCAALAP